MPKEAPKRNQQQIIAETMFTMAGVRNLSAKQVDHEISVVTALEKAQTAYCHYMQNGIPTQDWDRSEAKMVTTRESMEKTPENCWQAASEDSKLEGPQANPNSEAALAARIANTLKGKFRGRPSSGYASYGTLCGINNEGNFAAGNKMAEGVVVLGRRNFNEASLPTLKRELTKQPLIFINAEEHNLGGGTFLSTLLREETFEQDTNINEAKREIDERTTPEFFSFDLNRAKNGDIVSISSRSSAGEGPSAGGFLENSKYLVHESAKHGRPEVPENLGMWQNIMRLQFDNLVNVADQVYREKTRLERQGKKPVIVSQCAEGKDRSTFIASIVILFDLAMENKLPDASTPDGRRHLIAFLNRCRFQASLASFFGQYPKFALAHESEERCRTYLNSLPDGDNRDKLGDAVPPAFWQATPAETFHPGLLVLCQKIQAKAAMLKVTFKQANLIIVAKRKGSNSKEAATAAAELATAIEKTRLEAQKKADAIEKAMNPPVNDSAPANNSTSTDDSAANNLAPENNSTSTDDSACADNPDSAQAVLRAAEEENTKAQRKLHKKEQVLDEQNYKDALTESRTGKPAGGASGASKDADHARKAAEKATAQEDAAKQVADNANASPKNQTEATVNTGTQPADATAQPVDTNAQLTAADAQPVDTNAQPAATTAGTEKEKKQAATTSGTLAWGLSTFAVSGAAASAIMVSLAFVPALSNAFSAIGSIAGAILIGLAVAVAAGGVAAAVNHFRPRGPSQKGMFSDNKKPHVTSATKTPSGQENK